MKRQPRMREERDRGEDGGGTCGPPVRNGRTAGPAVHTNAWAARSTNATPVYHEFPDAMATADEHFLSPFAKIDIHTRNLQIAAREDLAKVVHGWKSYTAKLINEVVGGEGAVWQKEYYDRLIRNSGHYTRTVEYIRKNARMAERIGMNARNGRTAGPAVHTNARAARSTSSTGGPPVLNAPAARSTMR